MWYAAMAQLVEHILGKDEVPGPNPGSSSRQPRRETFGALVFYRDLQSSFGSIFYLGCLELLLYASERALRHRRRFGPHTPRRCVKLACKQQVWVSSPRANTRVAPDFSLRLGHTRGKTIIDSFLTLSCRCATPKGNLRGFGFL